jgi:hypothetical protein
MDRSLNNQIGGNGMDKPKNGDRKRAPTQDEIDEHVDAIWPNAEAIAERVAREGTIQEGGMDEPKYKHMECDDCTFLGSIGDKDGWIDMWLCGRVIFLRWADQPEEESHSTYNSFAFEDSPTAVQRFLEGTPWWRVYLEASRRAAVIKARRHEEVVG